jgi:thioredoxin reductase
VVGGGDSAVEAAMGLAQQTGNQVTLSYRRSEFIRIKERNAQRMRECTRTGKVNVIFDSIPMEFRQDRVLLAVGGRLQILPNDFVWIFAGGAPPYEFLRKIGVGFGMRDMTIEAGADIRRSQEVPSSPG